MDARDFGIGTAEEWVRITYKPTGFYFRIYPVETKTDRGLLTFLSIGQTPSAQGAIFSTKKEGSVVSIQTFDNAVAHFSKWVALLKQEFKQPDLWAEMEQTPLMFAEPETITDEQFTPAEIKLLEARVPHVEQQIIDLDLPPDAEAAITAIVQEVPSKAKRLTKKELADTLIGSFVKEGIKWTLTSEHVSYVWHACQHFFTLHLLS